MKKTLYSDRDYLDEKFKSVEDKIADIHIQVTALTSVLNGDEDNTGLVEKVRDNAKNFSYMLWGTLVVTAFIVTTHIQQASDFIRELFNSKIVR